MDVVKTSVCFQLGQTKVYMHIIPQLAFSSALKSKLHCGYPFLLFLLDLFFVVACLFACKEMRGGFDVTINQTSLWKLETHINTFNLGEV